MKTKFIIHLFTAMFAAFLFVGCGSSGSVGPSNIEGPELNLAEAGLLEINHFYVGEWSGAGSRPFFSVYLQDALSGEYMTCAGPDQGMDIASEAGVYYGNLKIKMSAVAGAKDHNTPIFKIVIVADQEDPCPATVADDDQIVGSAQINFGELLDIPINIGEGAAYIAFRVQGHEDIDVPEMEPASTDALTVGEVYFKDTPTGDIIPDYYITLYISNGNTYVFNSMIDPADMPEMRMPGLIYSWLDLAFAETEELSTSDNLLKTKAKVELLKNDGVVIGATGPEYIGDMIGRKVEFTNGMGHIKFRKLAQ